MQFEFSSSGVNNARELQSVSGFDALSRECPAVHPDLSTVQDDTAGAALFDLPGLHSGRVEMCNIKGDRREIHRRSRRSHVREETAERTASITNRRPGSNVNYPFAPAPHQYPHYNNPCPSVIFEDEN